jgi:amidase
VFGFKPSRGRTPCGPDAGELWLGLGVEHAITRSVRDSAALLDLTCAPDPTAPYSAQGAARPYLEEAGHDPSKLRIAFTVEPHLPATVHPDCIAAVHDAAQLCADLGHSVEEASPKVDRDLLAQTFFQLVCAAAASALELGEEALKKRPRRSDFETDTWIMAMLGRGMHSGRFIAVKRKLEVQARAALRCFEQYDVVLTPTLGRPPVRHGQLRPRGLEYWGHELLARAPSVARLAQDAIIKKAANRVFGFIPFTPLHNATGQPSMSVPLFWNEQGLPIGTLFSAKPGNEGMLFALAGQLERARPWAQRLPPRARS